MKPSLEKRWFYVAWIAACISVVVSMLLRSQLGDSILSLPVGVGILLGLAAAVSLQLGKKTLTARHAITDFEATIQLQARKAGLQSYHAGAPVLLSAANASDVANVEVAKSVGIENQPRVGSLLAFA